MMENIFYNLLFFLISFTVIYIISYLTTAKKIKKRRTNKVEWIKYLIKRFNLDKEKINYHQINFTTSLINAFIIAFVATLISLLEINYLWKMMGGFVLVFSLIYSLYEIYGRHLVNKGCQKRKKEK